MVLTCLLNTGMDVPSYHDLLMQRIGLASWHSLPSTSYVSGLTGRRGGLLSFFSLILLLITPLEETPSYRQMLVGTRSKIVRKVDPPIWPKLMSIKPLILPSQSHFLASNIN
jgi:hypothetical protein